MPACDERLRAVLDGYAKLLRERKLAALKHQPYLVQRVRELLLFARQHAGYDFEQTLDLFLAELGRRAGVQPWEIQQAADAVRIYRYQFRGAEKGATKATTNEAKAGNGEDLVRRLREVIRLRHYARNTEKSYLYWTNRFLAYRRQTGVTGEPTASDVKAFLTRLAMVEKVREHWLAFLPGSGPLAFEVRSAP